MNAFSQVYVTAKHELIDSMRSKRAVILFLLCLVGALVATHFFIKLLMMLEAQFVELLQLPEGADPGTVTVSIWESPRYERMLQGMMRDDAELAAVLAPIPPVSLFYGSIASMMMPLFVVFLSATRIADEMGSGSARSPLFRCSRLTWCLGKFWGQAVVLFPVLMLSAVAAWGISYFRLPTFDPVTTAQYMLVFGFKSWLYTLAWLGLALGVSQLTKSGNVATAIALILMIASAVLDGFVRYKVGPGLAQLWDSAHQLIPQGHWRNLWWPNRLEFNLTSAVMLLVLAHLYMMIGFFFTRRRDL